MFYCHSIFQSAPIRVKSRNHWIKGQNIASHMKMPLPVTQRNAILTSLLYLYHFLIVTSYKIVLVYAGGHGKKSDCFYFRTSYSDDQSSDSQSNGTHCHTDLNTKLPEIDQRARKKLVIASVLCLVFTIGEAVGWYLTRNITVSCNII